MQREIHWGDMTSFRMPTMKHSMKHKNQFVNAFTLCTKYTNILCDQCQLVLYLTVCVPAACVAVSGGV